MDRDAGWESLLRRMCAGDAEAFERFYAKFAPLAMGIAMRLLGDRMEAEDLCHDLFLEILRKGERYDAARGSMESWVAVMVRSRSYDRLRRRKFTVAGEAEERCMAAGTNESLPEEQICKRMQLEAVRHAAAQLPLPQRRALHAAYIADRSHSELASSWGVPLGTVKSWVRYGIHNVRKQLAKRGWADEMKGGDGSGESG